VCLQTSKSTCSPASAATLLFRYGITTTEQEMAELCLTRNGSGGTTWQGLYHGLAVKLKGTEWRVEIFECSLDELKQFEHFPVLLSVELRHEDAGEHFIYERDWGWEEEVPHTVALLGFDEFGMAEIGEPAFGLDQWRSKDLEILWHGRGMRVVPRN